MLPARHQLEEHHHVQHAPVDAPPALHQEQFKPARVATPTSSFKPAHAQLAPPEPLQQEERLLLARLAHLGAPPAALLEPP